MSKNQQKCNLKLFKILRLLEANQRKFEELKSTINDPDLKLLLLKFIENNHSYVKDLRGNLGPDYSSLQSLVKGKIKENKDAEDLCKSLSRAECMERCRQEEKAFESTYRDVLNSYYIQGDLKKMMQFQFNNIKVLFLKIRINDMIKSNGFSPHILQAD